MSAFDLGSSLGICEFGSTADIEGDVPGVHVFTGSPREYAEWVCTTRQSVAVECGALATGGSTDLIDLDALKRGDDFGQIRAA